MADNGRWFKLWTSALNDPHLNDLSIDDFGRWCKLGAFIKEQGNAGSITIAPPSRLLLAIMQCDDYDLMIAKFSQFPNVKITSSNVTEDVTNKNVTHSITLKNWHKYQIDSSIERTRKYREKNKVCDGGCDDNRREEKRRDKRNKKESFSLGFFEKVWAEWPNKKSKGQAEKTWHKLNPSEQLVETMLSTIQRAKTSKEWIKNNGEYIPHFSTWLNAKGWQDEYKPNNGRMFEDRESWRD